MTCYYAGDFETTTNEEETEVWLSCFAKVIDYDKLDTFKVNTSLEDFLKSLYLDLDKTYAETGEDEFIIFFHNLKFDGSFLLSFFLNNDIECTYFINDMGVWYSITLEFPCFTLTFRDSLKILNFSIATMAGLFKMPIAKGTTPLLKHKPEVIKPEWIDYIHVDVAILARGIFAMYYEENFTKYTSASEALTEFKRIFRESKRKFRDFFPILDEKVDDFCRKAYRGGWTFANPKTQGRTLNQLIDIYDINSMYPATMLQNALPIGIPKRYKGKPKEIKEDHYYIYHIKADFDLKRGYLPTIQIKRKLDALRIGVRTSDYVTTSKNEVIDLYLTNFDLDLFLKHYDSSIMYVETLEFQTETGLFDDYITTYRYKKENTQFPAEKQKAKIMLNSLYGKFGAKIISVKKLAYLDDKGILRFKNDDEEEVQPVYAPVALFVTSIARHFIISNAQENYDNFLYADTDSLHLFHSDSLVLDIDPSEFGKWAHEGRAVKAKYLRSKLYIEELIQEDGTTHLDVKGAGMTPEIKEKITFENFVIGATFEGKRASKQIKGGTLIYETSFKIRETDYLV